MANGAMSILDMSVIYGVYGEQNGIHIFKFFFLNSVIATFLGQVIIIFFETKYVHVLWFLAFWCIFGFFMVDCIPLTSAIQDSTFED